LANFFEDFFTRFAYVFRPLGVRINGDAVPRGQEQASANNLIGALLVAVFNGTWTWATNNGSRMWGQTTPIYRKWGGSERGHGEPSGRVAPPNTQ
jgi:hypothetical protein